MTARKIELYAAEPGATAARLAHWRDAKKVKRLGFARAIEASVDGEAPDAARLWKAGWNVTDKGNLNFTARSAKLVLKAYEERGNPLAWYYEHEDRIPIEQRGGAPMKGVCSAPSSELVVRDSANGPELWAEHIAWTAEARRQIITGERRQLSPIAAYDEETREIVEILNVSLCAEGATHFGTILASRAGREQGTGMEELLQKLMDAIDAKDWELAENLIQQMEALDNGEAMAKMGRMALKGAKDDEEKPPGEDETATKRLAAGRTAAMPSGLVAAAFSRELAGQRAQLEAATAAALSAAKQSRKATVQTLIAANRGYFDAVDEREHEAAADPDATTRFIKSSERKVKALLEANRDGAGEKGTIAAGRGDRRPPKDKPEGEETYGLTVTEIQVAGQTKVPLKDFAEAKKRHAPASRKGA